MSARTRSIRAGMERAIRRLHSASARETAWKAFRAFCATPEAHRLFNPPGSQAILRAERKARQAPSAGGRQP